jgi:hypothetical protein
MNAITRMIDLFGLVTLILVVYGGVMLLEVVTK